MIAKKYTIRTGTGVSEKYLPSFDKALIGAGVGNYNLVRLSSILPAKSVKVDEIDLTEGSLLPTAYSSISSNVKGERIVSAIGVGLPKNRENVGVIMEYSAVGVTEPEAMQVLEHMIGEAFDIRGWELDRIEGSSISAVVHENGETTTTFACIAEWE